MDFSYFIENKQLIEPAEKSGLYLVEQKHIPQPYKAFRMGLAGRPVDSATSDQVQDSNFAGRFGMYLQNWLPTDAVVYACLTVPRQRIMGFAERVMPASAENDNRPDYARLHLARTLIDVREEQYHRLALRYGMQRVTKAGVDPNKSRSEFFRGSLEDAKRALKAIGTGDFFTFHGNNIANIKKQTLTRGDPIETTHVPLRTGPRFTVQEDTVDLLQKDDSATKKALERLSSLKSKQRTPKTAPLVFEVRKKDLAKMGDKRFTRSMANLRGVRRSSRINR